MREKIVISELCLSAPFAANEAPHERAKRDAGVREEICDGRLPLRQIWSQQMLAEPLLNRKAAAQFIKDRGIPAEPSTLAKYATVGGGPPMRKFGRRVLYEPQTLMTWIDEKLSAPRRSTSYAGDARPRRNLDV